MAEAKHGDVSAAGRDIDIVDRKLPLRNAIGDDAPVDRIDALDMAGDHLPALGHGARHHLVHALVRGIALRVEAVVGSSHLRNRSAADPAPSAMRPSSASISPMVRSATAWLIDFFESKKRYTLAELIAS